MYALLKEYGYSLLTVLCDDDCIAHLRHIMPLTTYYTHSFRVIMTVHLFNTPYTLYSGVKEPGLLDLKCGEAHWSPLTNRGGVFVNQLNVICTN